MSPPAISRRFILSGAFVFAAALSFTAYLWVPNRDIYLHDTMYSETGSVFALGGWLFMAAAGVHFLVARRLPLVSWISVAQLLGSSVVLVAFAMCFLVDPYPSLPDPYEYSLASHFMSSL